MCAKKCHYHWKAICLDKRRSVAKLTDQDPVMSIDLSTE